MPGIWPRPSLATSRSSRPSICPSIDPQSTPSFTSSRPSPPTRSTRSSPSSIFSPAISSKQQPEKTPYRDYGEKIRGDMHVKQPGQRAEGLAACGLAGATVIPRDEEGDEAESGAEQKAAA